MTTYHPRNAMESIKRDFSEIDVGEVTAGMVDQVQSWVTEYQLVRRLEEARSRTEKYRRLLSALYERVRPVLSEALLFLVSWGGPPLFLAIFYLSTCLIRFSRYLSLKLEKPETIAVSRALAIISKMWSTLTTYYHDHQILGLEKIPNGSAALLVWYHGTIPIDYIGLVSRLYLRDGRMVHSVVDTFLSNLPGWDLLEKDLKLTAGGKGLCVDLLENGEVLGVAVGGAREALFDRDYSVDWGHRDGFAKVALLTGWTDQRQENRDISIKQTSYRSSRHSHLH